MPQGVGMELVGEPVAAVGDPPAEGEDGEGGDYSPGERESEVGDEAEGGEEEPEDFALHEGEFSAVGESEEHRREWLCHICEERI